MVYTIVGDIINVLVAKIEDADALVSGLMYLQQLIYVMMCTY